MSSKEHPTDLARLLKKFMLALDDLASDANNAELVVLWRFVYTADAGGGTDAVRSCPPALVGI